MKELLSMLTTLALLLMLSAAATAEAAVFDGGSGTEDDPYRIATVEQLAAFAASVNDGSVNGYSWLRWF